MTYFADLTSYNYNLPFYVDKILSVGWLNESNSFKRGQLNPEILTKLKNVMCGNENFDIMINQMRGFHNCDLCGDEEIMFSCQNKLHPIFLGSNEILIPSLRENIYYNAPSLILHYMDRHLYQPPKEFLEAIFEFDLSKKFNAQKTYNDLYAEYKEKYMKENNIASFW